MRASVSAKKTIRVRQQEVVPVGGVDGVDDLHVGFTTETLSARRKAFLCGQDIRDPG